MKKINHQPLKIAIIGAGLIGHKRAKALRGHDLIGICDLKKDRAQEFKAYNPNIIITDQAEEIFEIPGLQLVIVATSNQFLAPLSIKALQNNINVLVEKPGALNAREFSGVLEVLEKSQASLKVGFNHRYHPGIRKAFELSRSDEFGGLMFIRARYGHGGRLGYEKEWRAKVELSGGGELIDQGVHLIDLAQGFMGDFTKVKGSAHTYFWDMKVDDNAFLDLENSKGNKAWLHVSCTEWKNHFSLEIYGKKAKIQVEGLGGSYGVERCTYYQMLPEMGPPETTTWEYPFPDKSWDLECQDFIDNINDKKRWLGEANKVLENLKIVNQIYKESGYAHNS